MNLKVAANELIERGWWEEFCNLTGTSIWAVKEGLIDSDELLEIPQEMQQTIRWDFNHL